MSRVFEREKGEWWIDFKDAQGVRRRRKIGPSKRVAKDDKLRAAATEGLGRIGNPADEPALEKLWHDEDKMLPRLGSAFALVMEGKLEPVIEALPVDDPEDEG